MGLHPTLTTLLTTAADTAAEDARALERKLIRATWVHHRMADLRAAQKRADEAWYRLIDEHPDEDEELPPPPEQAELDAIWQEVWDVADNDRWPKKLYWSL